MPKLFGRETEWGVEPGALDGTREFVATYRAPAFVASLADTPGPRHLDSDFEMVQDTFRRFAENEIAPVAEHIHRENADIPEELIEGLAELGGFGLSVPVEYDGYSEGGESEYIGMVVATEELLQGVARRRRFADHPPRDPHPGPARRWHRGPEAAVAPEAGVGRGHGRGRRHRARLRLRRGRREGHRHPHRRAAG